MRIHFRNSCRLFLTSTCVTLVAASSLTAQRMCPPHQVFTSIASQSISVL